MTRQYLPGTRIEIVNEVETGYIKHALFDFDGTISLLREGWESIMHPVCVEMICGEHAPTPAIEAEVARMIDETTGIQTIFQMERLVEMVRAHKLVAEDKIRDARAYKKEYLDRLIKRVLVRLEQLEQGTLSPYEVSVHGVHDFIAQLAEKGTTLYVFSGTDRDDVRNEADKVGVARYFQEIWGALEDVEAYSKEKVIREIIAQHDLHGKEVMAVGDGPVEIRNVKACGGIGIGVASDEVKGHGINETKRVRLIRAGADIIIGDFLEGDALLAYLFSETSGK